ncbi:MAG: PadR family transcriptional regulator [Terriglobia bacterium]|jgi:DNA-binding PadR family transcriptional regulator|nr:PadR family transcriptional regulator [Terriglobia bacterium]
MPTASTLEYALLGLLRQSPQSGYDLRRTFASTPMRHFSDSPGSIYPALRRLDSRGWITAKPEPETARRRQVYRVTPAGRKALLAWLALPIACEDVIHNLDELMLRFAFHGENIEREATLKFVAQMEAALKEYIAELHQYYKTAVPHIASITGRLAFESGILSYEATLEWTRRARKQIERQL